VCSLNQTIKGAIFLSLAAAIWGGMYVVSKFALDTIPPMTLLFVRYLIASSVMLGICWYKGIPILPRGNWGILIQIGIIGYFISVGAQFIGTKLSSAHLGSLITTLSPVFLSLFAILLLKEKMTKKQLFSTLTALLGVIVIIGLPATRDESSDQVFFGSLFLLLAAVSWGYYSVLARKASQTYYTLQITTIGILVATVCTFPTIFFELGQWQVTDILEWPIILSALYLGIVSTAVAFFCWNYGLKLTPSHQAGLFFFLQPVVGTFLGWLLLKESLSVSFLIGSLFILFGVYLSLNTKQETT
jgi:drug/metabolite transporter (DMT)-like permease